MKIYKLFFAALVVLTLSTRAAYAQDAGTQLNDANDTSTYGAQDARDGEDASDAAGATFDGTPGGSVQDPSTLQPQPFSASSNSDE